MKLYTIMTFSQQEDLPVFFHFLFLSAISYHQIMPISSTTSACIVTIWCICWYDIWTQTVCYYNGCVFTACLFSITVCELFYIFKPHSHSLVIDSLISLCQQTFIYNITIVSCFKIILYVSVSHTDHKCIVMESIIRYACDIITAKTAIAVGHRLLGWSSTPTESWRTFPFSFY